MGFSPPVWVWSGRAKAHPTGESAVDGVQRTPAQVYRKVMPRKDAEAEAEADLEGLGE